MRQKFQIILTISMVVIFQIGFWSFAFLSKEYLKKEIEEQVKNDNKVIGLQIINLLKSSYRNESDFANDSRLQHLCDSIKLPNGGFICAINQKGNLVAGPGLKAGMTMPFTPILNHFNYSSTFAPTELKKGETFVGKAYFSKGGRTDIVASLPLNDEVRLFVHQNQDIIEKRASKYVNPLLLIGLIITVIAGIISWVITRKIVLQYESKIEKKNKELNIAVKEIKEQKEEITTQNNELQNRHEIVVQQSEKIKFQKDEIMASIQYAKRIQNAALPKYNISDQTIVEHFILFQPRGIVSGDFYWYHEFDRYIVITAADSTGHGVPGAFMSLLGLSFLNEIVVENEIKEAGTILTKMRNKIIKTLDQNAGSGGTSDGMDMALCIIEKETKKVQFAGAFNPFIYVRNNELFEIRGDRMPVGIHKKGEDEFTNHTFSLQSGDHVFLFSDGFADQFGGSRGRKFLIKNFRHLLLEISSLPAEEQKKALQITLNEWKGNLPQIDDILVIGFKIK